MNISFPFAIEPNLYIFFHKKIMKINKETLIGFNTAFPFDASMDGLKKRASEFKFQTDYFNQLSWFDIGLE